MPQPRAAPQQSASSSVCTPGPIGWLNRVTLLLLLAASIALRVFHLPRKPFWFDECFSVELARIDWRNFLHLLWWREANMSLYYVLLRIWLHFGQSPSFIRGLSVAAAVATVPALYWLGRMLYDGRVALFASALLTINAFHIRYSQEARSYALLVLLSTLSSGFLTARLRRPSRGNWRGYVIASVLAVYAHFYALLLLAAHMLVVRRFGVHGIEAPADGRGATLRKAWIWIGAAVSPLIVFVAKTGGGPIRWIQRPGLHDLLTFGKHFAGGNVWLLLAMIAAATAAVAPLGRRLLERNQPWEIWRCQFLLLWLLFPIGLTVVLSFVRPVFVPRYMSFCLPAFLLLAAAGVARLRWRWLSAATLALLLLLGWQGALFVYEHDYDDERDAAGAATNFVLDHARPGDGIIFHIPQIRVPYEFFRSLRAGTDTASPSFTSAFGPDIVYPHNAPGLDYRDFKSKLSADAVRTGARSHGRIWVFLMYNGPKLPDPTAVLLGEVLPQYFPKVQRWQFTKVEVRLYSAE